MTQKAMQASNLWCLRGNGTSSLRPRRARSIELTRLCQRWIMPFESVKWMRFWKRTKRSSNGYKTSSLTMMWASSCSAASNTWYGEIGFRATRTVSWRRIHSWAATSSRIVSQSRESVHPVPTMMWVESRLQIKMKPWFMIIHNRNNCRLTFQWRL